MGLGNYPMDLADPRQPALEGRGRAALRFVGDKGGDCPRIRGKRPPPRLAAPILESLHIRSIGAERAVGIGPLETREGDAPVGLGRLEALRLRGGLVIVPFKDAIMAFYETLVSYRCHYVGLSMITGIQIRSAQSCSQLVRSCSGRQGRH